MILWFELAFIKQEQAQHTRGRGHKCNTSGLGLLFEMMKCNTAFRFRPLLIASKPIIDWVLGNTRL